MKKKILPQGNKGLIPALQKAWIQITGLDKCPTTISEYIYLFTSHNSAYSYFAESTLNQIRINPLDKNAGKLLKATEEGLAMIVKTASLVHDNLAQYEIKKTLSQKFSDSCEKNELLWRLSVEGLKIFNQKGFEVSAEAILDCIEHNKIDTVDTTSFWKINDFNFSEISLETQCN